MPQILRAFVIFLFLAVGSNLLATEFKSAESFTLSSSDQIADDLIVTGKNVKIDGEVLGDLITFCRSNSIKGRVENSAFNFSQYLDVSGQINGSLTSFCQSLSLSGRVGRNLTSFCATLLVSREAVIEGELTAFSGDLDLEGEVKKGVLAHCDEAIISGHILGDVKIDAERLVILEGAVIEGNLSYKSPKQAKIDPKARITGEVKWREKVPRKKVGSIYRKIGLFNTSLLAGNLVTGLILITLFKPRWNRCQAVIKTSFLKSLGLGFVLAVCVPIAVIILAITLLGIPLALLSMVGYLVAFYLAKLVASTTLGIGVVRLFKKEGKVSLFWAFLFGYLTFWILSGFHILGTILYILAFFVGFGGLVLGNKENGKPAPVTTSVTPTAAS